MSGTPTTTSQESTAIHLQFVLQCTSDLCCSSALRKGKYIQYSSHFHSGMPPMAYASQWYRNMPPNLSAPIVRAGFRQNGFFADFYFWAAGFFRGFSRRIFSPHFCGKKCPEKSSRKIPGKILQILYNKNPPTHFCRISADWPGQQLSWLLCDCDGKITASFLGPKSVLFSQKTLRFVSHCGFVGDRDVCDRRSWP